jgi:hypothetical protein
MYLCDYRAFRQNGFSGIQKGFLQVHLPIDTFALLQGVQRILASMQWRVVAASLFLCIPKGTAFAY